MHLELGRWLSLRNLNRTDPLENGLLWEPHGEEQPKNDLLVGEWVESCLKYWLLTGSSSHAMCSRLARKVTKRKEVDED